MRKACIAAVVLCLGFFGYSQEAEVFHENVSQPEENNFHIDENDFHTDAGIRFQGLYLKGMGLCYKTDLFAEYSGATVNECRLGAGADVCCFGGVGESATAFWGGSVYSVFERNSVQFKTGGFITYDFFTKGKLDYGAFFRINRNALCFKSGTKSWGFSFGAESYLLYSVLYRDYFKKHLAPEPSKAPAENNSDDSAEDELQGHIAVDSVLASFIIGALPKFYCGITFRL